MNYRVVIIEDDPMVTEVNRNYIEAAGPFAVVGSARRGADGVNLVRDLAPDLVVLDHYLPDMNGLEVLKAIRGLEVDVDVIMVTAAQDTQTIREVLRFGAVDYVIKPFKADRLASALLSCQKMRELMRPAAALSQDQVDRLRQGLAAAGEPCGGERADGPPKGLTEWTLRQVTLFLINSTHPASAAEVGISVGLARGTARRYLDWLVQQRRARVSMTYGGVGRPVYRYQLL